MIELRDYQTNVIRDLTLNLAAGLRKNCIVAATGSGKTVIAASIIKKLDSGRRRCSSLTAAN
jgi:superfamily II DNA or RNA helicase